MHIKETNNIEFKETWKDDYLKQVCSFANSWSLHKELTYPMLLEQHASHPRNRSLATIFYRAGYIEAWGRGTVIMVEECAKVGLPKPVYSASSGGFSMNVMRVSNTTVQDTVQDTVHTNSRLELFISKISGEMSRDELQNVIQIKHREHFRKEYLVPAIQLGLIEMTIPAKPNSKLQKYRLTVIGKSMNIKE